MLKSINSIIMNGREYKLRNIKRSERKREGEDFCYNRGRVAEC